MALVVILCSVLSSSSVTSEVLGQGTNTSSSCEASRAKCFHNYQVWRIPATYGLSKRFSQQQWNGIIKKLENVVDFWSGTSLHDNDFMFHNDTSIDFLVSPKQQKPVRRFLVRKNIPFKVSVQNVQSSLDLHQPEYSNIDQHRDNQKFDSAFVWTQARLFAEKKKRDGKNRRRDQRRRRRGGRAVRWKRQTLLDSIQIVGANTMSIFQPRPDPASDRLIHILHDTRKEPKYRRVNDRNVLLNDFPDMNWFKYQRLGTIYGYLYRLQQLYPGLVDVNPIGVSVEGRDILVVKIGFEQNYHKPAIFIEAGIHAREWISPATATYIISELVENVDLNRDILEFYDIYVLPIMNPDGYEYSHTTNRFWRKNRAGSFGLGLILPMCSGVDLNRNFDYAWGAGGMLNPRAGTGLMCMETYQGARPFSEPETRAVSEFLKTIKDQLVMYISLHSYGQKIIYPWSHSGTKIRDWRDLDILGRMIRETIDEASGGRYRFSVGSSPDINYYSNGGSDDWVRGELGIKWVFLLELPDRMGGRHGFVLPAREIIPVGHSVFHGVRRAALEVRRTFV